MKRILAPVCIAAALALTACSSPAPSTSPSAAKAESKTLTVFAAASLTKSFNELKVEFEKENPGVTVKYSYDGSSTLVDQIKGGAPADVFASADEKNMTRAVDEKLVTGKGEIFATNVLTLVVAPGNPKKITGLNDSLKGTKLVVCASGVPCGNATETLTQKLGVTLTPVSKETKVTDVLGKVTSGEADAGLVYETDAAGAGDKVATVKVPGSDQVVNKYPIAVVANSKNADLANKYIAMVKGEKGKSILKKNGFGAA